MNRNQVEICSELLHVVRSGFRAAGVPEVMLDKITKGTGACENVPTVYTVGSRRDDGPLFLSQTDQLLIEELIIRKGLGSAYTIARSFRDEPKVGDGRHLAEFTLCEYEARDQTLEDLIKFCKKQLQHVCRTMSQFPRLSSAQRVLMANYAELDYPVVTYTEVVQKLSNMGVSIRWGDDLSSRDEEFICGIWGEDVPVPVMVTHYPESIKFFNMYETRDSLEDRRTVDCCDFLLPHAGETWGGSRREVDGKRLRTRLMSSTMLAQMRELGGSEEAFEPYLQLFDEDVDAVDRAGFGLGMGRLAQFVLGSNEVIAL